MMLGALPPSSSETFLRFTEAAAAIFLPTSVLPVNATLSTPGWSTSAAPASPKPGRMLTTPAGTPGLEQQLAQPERGQRGLLGGLEDDRVARGDRGDDLEAGHEQREVPRHDAGDDADRLAARVGVEVTARHRHRDGGALHLGGPPGEVAEQLRGGRDVPVPGGLDALAVVERLELGELVGVGLDQVADAPQQVRAVARRESATTATAPRRRCGPPRPHGRRRPRTPGRPGRGPPRSTGSRSRRSSRPWRPPTRRRSAAAWARRGTRGRRAGGWSCRADMVAFHGDGTGSEVRRARLLDDQHLRPVEGQRDGGDDDRAVQDLLVGRRHADGRQADAEQRDHQGARRASATGCRGRR